MFGFYLLVSVIDSLIAHLTVLLSGPQVSVQD